MYMHLKRTLSDPANCLKTPERNPRHEQNTRAGRSGWYPWLTDINGPKDGGRSGSHNQRQQALDLDRTYRTNTVLIRQDPGRGKHSRKHGHQRDDRRQASDHRAQRLY